MPDPTTGNPKLDFLLLGEAVVDLISTAIVSTLEDANSFQRFPGGEVSNLAMNLSHLGFRCALGVCVGDDGFGHYLKHKYASAGVQMDLVQTTKHAPTTLIPITRHTKSPDFIVYRGADKHLRMTPQLKKAVRQCSGIHTSAFSLSHDPARNTIMECLELAQQEDKLVSLDPNYHPRIWPDRPNFISYLKDVFPLVTVTKPSLDDSARIFGKGYSPDEYLERFLELGAQWVALTMGREGVLLGTSRGDRYRLQAQPLSVVDVTGAGDAFWSGFLAGICRDLSPLQSAQLGQAIAEHKINTVGPVDTFPALDVFIERSQNVEYSLSNKLSKA